MTPNLDDSGIYASSEAPACRLPSHFSSLRRQQPHPMPWPPAGKKAPPGEWDFRVWRRGVEGEEDIKGREGMSE